jgi:EmrB/QacA subfamily drug resistance transporter
MAVRTEAPITAISSRRRYGILAICCLSLFIVGLDVTVVNVALPSIGRDLNTSVSGLQWTVDAYTLVLASLLMLSGSTADRIGRRRTFQAGLVIFSLGSLLCSLAPTVQLLVTFRVLQALGGSMLNPVAMAIITNTFTARRERAQAIGVWSAMAGLSTGLGPVVGGALVSSAGWRSIFWINVPIAAIACVLTAIYVPESRPSHPRRVDSIAQVLLVIVLAALTFGSIEGPQRGWGSPLIVGAFAIVATGTMIFIAHERKQEEPLLDLRFFHSTPFSGAIVIAVLACVCVGGFLFLNTLYLQEARGLSALQAGLWTLPVAVVGVVLSPVSGALVGRRGARTPLVMAGVSLAVSGLMLTHITANSSFVWLFAAYLVFGIGFGVVNAPITNTAVSGMPDAQAGVAAGVASTSRQVGMTLGAAVLGGFAASATSKSELASATHAGWWVIAVCGVLIVALGLTTTSPRARASAERAAAAFA